VTLTQDTDYPRSGRIALRIDLERAAVFTLKLRIPQWSTRSRASLNGQPVQKVTAGQYLVLSRTWQAGDTVILDLDLSLHFWAGERECEGLTSVYRGPILLAYDHRYNLDLAAGRPPAVRPNDEQEPGYDTMLPVPTLDARTLPAGRLASWDDWLPPWILYEVCAGDDRIVRLCDFGSAGEAGTPYRSWLPVSNVPQPRAFGRTNPLRSFSLR
jgi:hypothetical protein